MRVTSIILALGVAAGIAYWFGFRHDGGIEAMLARPDPVAAAPAAPAAAEPASEGTRPEAEARAPIPVLTLETRAEETARRLTIRGETAANRLVEVRAETTGLVASEPLRRGTRVAEGDLLCRLDPGSRPAQLAEARALLAEAEAEYNAADRLSSQGFAAETSRIGRAALLEAARAEVELMEFDIARLEIRAPFAGLLESDTAELGSRLAEGELCAKVIDLSTVKAIGYVSENDVDLLELGQPATARLVNGAEAAGRVTFVSRMADPETRTFEVEVTLPNDAGRLRDGMTAEIVIELPGQRATLVPQSALTLDDDGRLGVRIAVEGRARFAPVSVLRDAERGIWVTGLPDTAEIIVVGQEFVRDGREIAPTPTSWDQLG